MRRYSICLLALVVCATAIVWVGAATASAHAMRPSAVELTVGEASVGDEVQLPLDRLAVALGHSVTPAAAEGSMRTQLERYVRSHTHATGADGERWKVSVTGSHVETIEGGECLVVSLELTPRDGEVTDFDLRYDAIIDQLVTHKAIATVQTEGTSSPETLGLFDWDTKTLHVDAGGSSWLHGFSSMVRLGVEHVGGGADHLLFLLMLLVPAPLVARGGRWRRRDDGSIRSFGRVMHVVTAFAIGHSITLALATLGIIHPPTQLVESLIALSILVSAIHALRPLVPGGESLIAAGFGLIHGLAFGAVLSTLGLSGGALATSLLGFNLGIELTQILVVALIIPSLLVLSRSRLYSALRITLAACGIVLSGAWILDRSGTIAGDPFEPMTNALIAHPFLIAGTFALLAAASRCLPEPEAEGRERGDKHGKRLKAAASVADDAAWSQPA